MNPLKKLQAEIVAVGVENLIQSKRNAHKAVTENIIFRPEDVEQILLKETARLLILERAILCGSFKCIESFDKTHEASRKRQSEGDEQIDLVIFQSSIFV
ncbi:hypothetical protein RJT34_11269 [Clitoria ternatea]|uniref:Uncharacterized protein n=1 Tax=Clitoria ternatea TaxID=43366 RepID=A0AAN9PIA9_CLITE